MENALLLNVAEYFDNPDLSDVTITIREELQDDDGSVEAMDSDAESHEQQQQEQQEQHVQIAGHRVLLSSCSSLYKSMLARWSDQAQLELLVPTGQLAVGRLLIQCIYQPQPQLSHCSQLQLVQLMQLADKHDVGRAVFAASSELSSIPTAQLQWEVMLAIYSLPPGCPELDAYKPVYKAAAARVQQELGDLELAWQDAEKQQLLLELPHAAVLDLLKSNSTRVATENTVAYTVQAWGDHQQRQQQQQQQQQQYPSHDQLQQLAQQIRVQHCSQLYISIVMVHMSALAPCFTAAQWAYAGTLGLRSGGNPQCSDFFAQPGSKRVQTARAARPCLGTGTGSCWRKQQEQQGIPAGFLGPRASSGVDGLIAHWWLPISELAAYIDEPLDSGDDYGHVVRGPSFIWAGRRFGLVLAVLLDEGGPERDLAVGAILADCATAMCTVNVTVSAERTGASAVTLREAEQWQDHAAVQEVVHGVRHTCFR